ncbi:kinase-like protein [Rickenella mellea]|uniref:Kinase-like protein n=1 Tax=Rickenella mellea TaxID=50990 RepID=A0A4Y7PGX7_9AGAM|nr:kinase-like protein [Rickenella mellea]
MTRPSSAPRKGEGSSTAIGSKDLLGVPKHLDITSRVTQTDGTARAKYEHYHLYYGMLQRKKPVAIKRLRSSLRDNEPLQNALSGELKRWCRLQHRNILRILGATVDERGFPAFITEWVGHGSVLDYVKKNKQADVFNVVRKLLNLLTNSIYGLQVKGIAEGLAYLHKENVVHADLRSDNILVTDAGVPLVTDFGITRLLVVTHTIQDIKELMRRVRWMAIELVKPRSQSTDNTNPSTNVAEQTKESDVWAFGMVVYELLTKSHPFAGIPDIQVLIIVVGGGLPNPPRDIKNRPPIDQSLWELCKRCWNKEPSLRPTMSSIVAELKKKSFQKAGLCSENLDDAGSSGSPVRARAKSLPSRIAALKNSPLETVPPVPPLRAASNASSGPITQSRSPHVGSSVEVITDRPPSPLRGGRRTSLSDVERLRRNSSPSANLPRSRPSRSPSNVKPRRVSTVGQESTPPVPLTSKPSPVSISSDAQTHNTSHNRPILKSDHPPVSYRQPPARPSGEDDGSHYSGGSGGGCGCIIC